RCCPQGTGREKAMFLGKMWVTNNKGTTIKTRASRLLPATFRSESTGVAARTVHQEKFMGTLRIRMVLFSLLTAVLAQALAPWAAVVPVQQAAGSSQPSSTAAFFANEVLPVLKATCFKCHGDTKGKGGLSLASRAGLLKGCDLGPAVSLERPEESLLLKAI